MTIYASPVALRRSRHGGYPVRPSCGVDGTPASQRGRVVVRASASPSAPKAPSSVRVRRATVDDVGAVARLCGEVGADGAAVEGGGLRQGSGTKHASSTLCPPPAARPGLRQQHPESSAAGGGAGLAGGAAGLVRSVSGGRRARAAGRRAAAQGRGKKDSWRAAVAAARREGGDEENGPFKDGV